MILEFLIILLGLCLFEIINVLDFQVKYRKIFIVLKGGAKMACEDVVRCPGCGNEFKRSEHADWEWCPLCGHRIEGINPCIARSVTIEEESHRHLLKIMPYKHPQK